MTDVDSPSPVEAVLHCMREGCGQIESHPYHDMSGPCRCVTQDWHDHHDFQYPFKPVEAEASTPTAISLIDLWGAYNRAVVDYANGPDINATGMCERIARAIERAVEARSQERVDALVKVAEYAQNLDAIWHAPHADNGTMLATQHLSLDKGFVLLRAALLESQKEREARAARGA